MVHVWHPEGNPEELVLSTIGHQAGAIEFLSTGPFHWPQILLSHVLLQKH